MTVDYAERARALVGTRFRPQGRSLEGVDCVGLICQTYRIPEARVRRNYRLRGDHREELEATLGVLLRRVRPSGARSGDLLLMQPAADQLHLAVKTALGFVHAHAGIGRVVETPGVPQWPLIGVYRARMRKRRS